jgi:hypothetical protein
MQLRGLGSGTVGRQKALMGFTPGMPVLIVPGFMSSGLEIQESSRHPEWVGKRAWLDLQTLGLQAVSRSLQSNGSPNPASPAAVVEAGDSPMSVVEGAPSTEGASSSSDEDDEETEEGSHKLHALKNEWIRHMLLGPGGWEDPPGVRVRPIESNFGLDAVEYLVHGMIGHQMSWVFAGIVQQLRAVGYEVTAQRSTEWQRPPWVACIMSCSSCAPTIYQMQAACSP